VLFSPFGFDGSEGISVILEGDVDLLSNVERAFVSEEGGVGTGGGDDEEGCGEKGFSWCCFCCCTAEDVSEGTGDAGFGGADDEEGEREGGFSCGYRSDCPAEVGVLAGTAAADDEELIDRSRSRAMAAVSALSGNAFSASVNGGSERSSATKLCSARWWWWAPVSGWARVWWAWGSDFVALLPAAGSGSTTTGPRMSSFMLLVGEVSVLALLAVVVTPAPFPTCPLVDESMPALWKALLGGAPVGEETGVPLARNALLAIDGAAEVTLNKDAVSGRSRCRLSSPSETVGDSTAKRAAANVEHQTVGTTCCFYMRAIAATVIITMDCF